MANDLWFWDILGIGPTKDKAVIKQAFSKNAHKTNPEDDPEGYSKLHDAYKAALTYAASDAVSVSDPEIPTKQNSDVFDFSSVKENPMPSDLEPEELKIRILEIKKENNVNTYSELFNHSQDDLGDISVTLFSFYSALAVKTGDIGVWDTFFSEPLISIAMEYDDFRQFIAGGFPDGDANRAAIARHFESNRENIESKNRIYEQDRKKAERKYKLDGMWSLFAACSAVLTAVLLVMTRLSGFNKAQVIATVCMSMTLFLSCLTRHFAIYAIRKDSRARMITSVVLFILVVLLVVFSWIFMFYFGAITDNFYAFITFVLCAVFSCADVACLLEYPFQKSRD